MRKLIFILAFLTVGELVANPVTPPPVISEFFYNDGDWKLEIFISEAWSYAGVYSFDDLLLICNADTAQFNSTLTLEWNTLMVIDSNSLTSSFEIDANEDWIYIVTSYYWNLDEGIRYGGTPIIPWHVTTPGPEESIVQQRFTVNGMDDFYSLMKELNPSIGYNEFECSTRGMFSGYVFDQSGNPVPEVKLHYCQPSYCTGLVSPAFMCFETDENGFFEADQLFCNWHVFFLNIGVYNYLIDTLFIEPDSAHYKEYILTGVGIPVEEEAYDISIFAAPNPFSQKTTFHISIPDHQRWHEGKITIRNMNGQVVDIIEFPNAVWSGNEFTIDWYPAMGRGNILPGLYLYSLEIDDKFIASEKIIVQD